MFNQTPASVHTVAVKIHPEIPPSCDAAATNLLAMRKAREIAITSWTDETKNSFHLQAGFVSAIRILLNLITAILWVTPRFCGELTPPIFFG